MPPEFAFTWDSLGQPVATLVVTMAAGWLMKNKAGLSGTKLGLSVAGVSVVATALWTWQAVASAEVALAPVLPAATIEAGWNWLASMGAHQFLKTAKQDIQAP